MAYANASRHKGAGLNADSIDVFIDLVQANINSTSINLNFILNQIYQNNLPPPIKHYFTDVYLFCLHNDPLNNQNFATRHPHIHPLPKPQPRHPHLPRKVCPPHAPLQLCRWNPNWNKPYHQHNATTSKNYISPSPNQQASYYLSARLSSLT